MTNEERLREEALEQIAVGLCHEITPAWPSHDCFRCNRCEGTWMRDEDEKHSHGCPTVVARDVLAPTEPAAGEGEADRIYPCDGCGKMRTKAEGGTTFTLCEECWKNHYPPEPSPSDGEQKADTCTSCGYTRRHSIHDDPQKPHNYHGDSAHLFVDEPSREFIGSNFKEWPQHKELTDILMAVKLGRVGVLRAEDTILALLSEAPEQPIDVVAAVRQKDGLVWLCKRNSDGAHAGLQGLWEYPGGKVEKDEQLRDALIRELQEEFPGVNPTIGRVLDSINSPYDSKVYRVTFFEVEMDDPESHPTHTEVRWMTTDEACAAEHLPSGTIFNAKHLAPKQGRRIEGWAEEWVSEDPDDPRSFLVRITSTPHMSEERAILIIPDPQEED